MTSTSTPAPTTEPAPPWDNPHPAVVAALAEHRINVKAFIAATNLWADTPRDHPEKAARVAALDRAEWTRTVSSAYVDHANRENPAPPQ